MQNYKTSKLTLFEDMKYKPDSINRKQESGNDIKDLKK